MDDPVPSPEHDERMRAVYAAELPDRALRPPPERRLRQLQEFLRTCRERSVATVLEVGCGAGRDGAIIAAAGLGYTGTDLSPVGVRLCRDLGLETREASAVALPFEDDRFDAGWSMSTLMHLPGDDVVTALAELRRVLRRGGVLEVGLWGGATSGSFVDATGRYFRHRTDEEVRALLAAVGTIEHFDTWDHLPDGGHYQWSRVRVG